jgi:hypothetical protein
VKREENTKGEKMTWSVPLDSECAKEVVLTLDDSSLQVAFVSRLGDAIHGADGLKDGL